MHAPSLGVTIGRALLLGFGAILALWLVSSYDLLRRLSDVETGALEFSTRFNQSEELLVTVRAEVLLASVYVRDAVLDVEPDALPFYRERLERTRLRIEEALQQYLPDVDSEVERERWTRLQAELGDYWTELVPVLSDDIGLEEAQALLRRDVIPTGALIDRISDDLLTLNLDAFSQHQAEVAQLHRTVRRQVWWTSGIALLLGLVVALVAARHAGRLETTIRRQHLQEREHKRDLQRLAARLVHAQEEERRTIARDLHDEIGQALTAVRMDLAVIERRARLPDDAAHLLVEAGTTMDGMIRMVRDLSQLLHPAMLDDFGLPATLDAYVQRFSRRTGMRAELVTDGMQARMAPDLELCIYRIVQEALTNVARHAQASSCRVILQRRPASVSIAIEDDGRGMEAADRQSGGLGLMGIRERVSELGGTVALDSGAGTGTRLRADLPVTPDAAANRGAGPNASPVSSEGDGFDGHTAPSAG
jgi:signal transduction histidine kinase